jgi:hypothetical protein
LTIKRMKVTASEDYGAGRSSRKILQLAFS